MFTKDQMQAINEQQARLSAQGFYITTQKLMRNIEAATFPRTILDQKVQILKESLEKEQRKMPFFSRFYARLHDWTLTPYWWVSDWIYKLWQRF